MTTSTRTAVWVPEEVPAAFAGEGIAAAAAQFRSSAHVIRDRRTGAIGVGLRGQVVPDDGVGAGYPALGSLPPLYPEWLGDRGFSQIHGVRFPYVAGEMANGIASARLVISMASHGRSPFWRRACLAVDRVAEALDEIERALDRATRAGGRQPDHSPAEPAVEDAIADRAIRRRCG